MKPFDPSTETYTTYLRRELLMVGHTVLARYMFLNGYPFRYAYFVIFNKLPKEKKHEYTQHQNEGAYRRVHVDRRAGHLN